ncbi:TPA: hypothetical protein R1X36_000666 [Campylobacter upsaliensis]|nr:hypothetical protein [Campylobacter upsaliensis]
MQFNFNFEAFEKSGKEKSEAINYLKGLNSSLDFDKLESDLKGDENAIYEALKGGNFSFSKPSIEQTRQKLLKNKENEALKAEFNTSLSWLDNKQDYNFYDFKKAKERANSKEGLIKADLEAQEKELKRKEALFEKRLKNESIFTKSLRDTADNLGLNAVADTLEMGLNKLGFKDENYIFESEKEDIKKRALKGVREKLQNNEENFSESEKYALRDKYDELDYKKALEKEKEKLRLIQKDSGYNKSEVEFMEEELGFFHTLFNEAKDTVREFKDEYKSEGVIGADVQKAVNVLKQFEESELLRHIFSDKEKKQELQQEYLKNALVIAELNGFDDVGLSRENELYFIKKDKDKEQKYLVNTGFLDNFWDLIENSKFEIAGGVAGGIKGFNSGKSAKGKVVKSVLGAAAGSFGGALMDAKIADMYLNRESNYKRNLEYALQAGLLSIAGDGVIIAAKPMAKGVAKGVKNAYAYAKERTPLGLFSTIPSQNINAANKIIDEVFTPEMKEELKQAQKQFGGGVRGEDLANPVFEKLKESFAKKYGKEDIKTQKIAKLAEIFNQNSLKTKQQEMLDLIRSDKDGSTLAYLLEVAKDDVKIQNNLKNMLNLASLNVEKNLKNLNINPREIKSILDEFEAGNKAAFKEVESQISKLYNEDIRVVLDRTQYENIKKDFLENGVNLDEMTPFLRDLENNVFAKEGVTFAKLNNFRKNLNFYIFNKDKTPNFINTLKKISETSLKAEIDKGIDNIFNELPNAYASIKELYSTSLKDYAAMKELNESIKNLKLQDSAKSADEVVDSLIKYAKGQGENGVNNLQKIKTYLGEENNAFLEMQILNRLFKESVVENDRAKVRVFDSEGFLNRVKELVGDTPAPLGANLEARALSGASQGPSKQENFIKKALNKDEAKLFLENLNGAKIPKKLDIEGFLKELESVENKENFISHLSKKEDAQSRLAYLNLVEPTLKEADLILHNGKRQDYIKKFSDGKDFFTLLITEENGKRLITFLPKTREDFIKNKIDNASLIQSFTSRASKQGNGLANESITQPLFKSKEARDFLEELSPSPVPKQISIDEFLNTLENFKNKENFLKHIEKDPKRKDYLNLIEPTLKEPDIAFKKLENGVEKEKFIKKFSDGKDFFYLLATKDNKETILTAFKTDKINTILKEFNADIIPTFIRQGSKGKAAGTTAESITQPLFKSKEAREFLELVEGFHKLYKNDAIIAKNFTQGTASQLSTSIATSAEGAIKQKVVKGGFDPIFRLLPDGILFGLFSKQIQGGALRYHLKKALSRSLNYDDFKLKLERELKRRHFNSNTSRLIEKFMQNLEDFNAEKEAKLARIREEEELQRAQELKRQEAIYKAQEANNLKDILEAEESPLKEDFGVNFEGFKGKEAVEKLLEEQRGQVKGAFYKEGLGDIDLVWGNKDFGLEHIINKHGGEFENLAKELSEAVENGKIVKDDKGRLRLEYENKIVGIKDNWKGEKTAHWVVTAYVKKEKEASLYTSTSFTKGETLPLNSKESIAQKGLNLHEKLYLKDNDTPLNVEYKIVNKDDIKPSFELSKTQYRSEKQEELIEKIKNEFNPDLLVNIRGDLKKGNPIITQNGEVLSGNHRAAALKELEGENLSKYQKAVKEAFGVELKENEMLVRVVSEDTSEAEIRRFSAASNEGLENNLGEQGVSLFAKYQDKIKALKMAKRPFVADDVYNLKYLVNKALGETSITKENDTSKALFASLARGRNNTILKALNELEKENLEQVSKVANMFFDNAGAFYNLTHDLDLPKMQNLQNYFSDVLVSAARADFTRAEDFTKLNEDIRAFLDSSDKEAMLKLSPNLVSDLLTKAMGAGFARFARLENPSSSLFDFLNGLKAELIEKGAPDLFSGGKGIKLNERDEFDFAKELILKGQDSEEKFRLYQNLEELKAWKSKSSLNQPTKELKHKMLERLKPLFKQEIYTKDGFKGVFNLKSLSKMTSDKAIQKSINNGFSKEEHLRAVLDIERLFKNANLAKTYNDEKGGKNVLIHRFNSEFENANALITTKESLDKDLNKIYSLELELTPRFSDEVRPTDTKSNTGDFNSQEHMADENIATIAKTDEESIAQNAKSESEKEVLERQIPFIEAEIQKYEAKTARLDERIKKTQTRIQPYLDEINALQKQYDELYFTETRGEGANAKKWLKLDEIKAKQEELRKPYNEALFKFIRPYERLKGKVQTEIQKLKFGLQDRAERLEEIQNEALTSKAQKAWLEAFNLKSLEEEAIVEIPADLKERLGKEIKLNKKDFEKLVKNKREKYIEQIKETFKEPEAVFIDENDDLIFTKTFNDKLFFVNVNRDYGEAFKALSLAPKKNNNLLNKLNKAKEILKLDSKLRDYTAQQAFTGVLSASNKPSSESIAQNPQQKSLNLQEIEQALKARISQINDEIIAIDRAFEDKAFKENLKEVSKVKPILEALKKEWEALEPTIVTWTHTDYSKAKPKKYYNRKPNLSNLWHIEETLDVYKGYARENAHQANQVKREIAVLEKYVKLLKDKEAEVKKLETDKKALLSESYIIPVYNKLREAFKNGQHTTKQILEAKNIKQDSPLAKFEIDNIAQLRQYLEHTFNITPLKEFGTNYAEFYRDGKGAVEKLLAEKQGQVAGAFYKEGLGEIDLVWGDEKIGLKKIIEKHLSDFENFEGKDEAEKMVNALNEIIEKGKIITENGINTLWLKKGDEYYLVGLSKGWNGKGENEWIITSYKKTKGKIPDELKGDTANLSAYSDEFNPLLTSKDEPLNSKDIITQRSINLAMEKFHFDEAKAKDLLEWHKNSHALTKDENGLPKVFYHGTYSKFRVFRRVGKASQQGFFFTPSQKATEEYGDITLNTFLNIKNPFRADELKINKEADLQKWADILKLDYDKEKYESFKDLKTKLEKVKEATKKAGFKFHSASGGGVYVIDNKGRNSFINLEELDKENKRVVEAFKGLETEDIYFYYVVRNEFDLVLYALNKNDRYFHTSGRDEVKHALEKLGYDGAVLNDTIITVFNSNQIKHIDNKGSFTDTKGNVTSKKPKDKEVEFSYFNEKSDDIYHSNPHLGAGLVGGVLNGVEQDENGNLSFDPVKFAMGFLGGAAGSKAVKESIKWRANKVKKAYPNIAKNNPTLMEQIAKRDLLTYAKNETQNALTRLLNKNKLFDSTKGLFAGEKALLNEAYAPHKARLEKAKELEGSGADEIEIWEKTGWYKDKDHKWKFEISQRGGELDLAKIKDKDSEAKLGEILKDDELFKAYPQLRDMSVKHVDLSGNYGFYYVPYNDIKLVRPHIQLDIDEIKTSPYKVKEVLYHEIQHAIQHKEQFAYGLSYMAETYERYLKQHGEVEARNIQERMKNPTKIHPHKTMDTDIEDTIAESTLSTEYSEAFSRKLEKSFLDESGRIAYKSLMQNAEKLPKELNLRAFKEQFKGQKYAIIKTPIKDVKINTDYAFYHLLKSGNGKENRKYISGGILATLQNPLFVTKDERGSYYFYKPFKINENLINLVSVEVDKNDKLLYKTSYEASKNKLKSMIEKYDLIYFAGGIQPVRAE